MGYKMSAIQSKQYNTEDSKLSWDDVWFMHLNKVGEARRDGNVNGIRCALRFFESSLAHKIDAIYEEELDYINYKCKLNGTLETSFYDLKCDALVKLLGRVTYKVEDLTETSNNSEVIKELISKMQGGIGQNLMITGSPGSGKSWACLTIAEKITSKTGALFDPKAHVVFTLEEFWKLYNNKELCPPGSVIIFEEVGVNVNSKAGMTKENRTFGAVFQTMRYRGIAVILNTPALGFLDKTPRSLLHWWLETKSLNKKDGYCEIKPKMVEVDQQKGDLFFPYPRLRDNQRITRLRIYKADNEIIEKYEKSAKEYKDKLGIELQKEIFSDSKTELSTLELEYIERRKGGELQKTILQDFNWNKVKGSKLEKKIKALGVELPENRKYEGHKTSESKESKENTSV